MTTQDLTAAQHEWIEGSGISSELTDSNLLELTDQKEVQRRLNWRHYSGGPGWWVSGIDPMTGDLRKFGQFKPAAPLPATKPGEKVSKYLSGPKGQPTEPIFLKTPEPDYWPQLIQAPSRLLVLTEGVKKAGASITAGIPAIALTGVWNGQDKKQALKPDLQLFAVPGRPVVLMFDADVMTKKNVQDALKLTGRLLENTGAVVTVGQLPQETKGLDDFVVKYGPEAYQKLIDQAVPFRDWLGQTKAQRRSHSNQAEEQPEKEFLQKACKALYSDGPWICFGDTLYQWTGTYYKETPDQAEYPRLRTFCNEYVEWKKREGEEYSPIYPFAKPRYVKEVLEWQKLSCTVLAEHVNPPGLNCTNGILELHWEDKTLVPRLIPHSPEQRYLSEPKVTYDPEACPSEYERLMLCLDPASREIWERTIAAALDLATVRKFKGRCVRALFLKGDGANGKDTLRGLVQELFGTGAIASCSVTDFAQYDSGTYFKVYPLRGKRINWPSENADAGRVDQLRGLRAAITGDPLSFEAKYKQGIQESCKAVFLFNINEAPALVTTLKASASRWGVVPFNKTYSGNPGHGEIQADPRFKEDPLFVQEKILPAFLNQLLKQLQVVVLEGIDHTATQEILDEIQRQSSHLLQFCQDTGLVHDPGGSVSVADLWKRLRQWYIETGTLIVETTSTGKEKLIWVDQVRRGDRNVKGLNQIAQRFTELFPKAKRTTYRPKGSNNPESRLAGICFAKIDQRDQWKSPEVTLEANLIDPNCPTDWVETDQREPPTDQRELLAPGQSVTQLTNGRYPTHYPVENVKPLQEDGSGAHVGHVTQFHEKTLSVQSNGAKGGEEELDPEEWGDLM